MSTSLPPAGNQVNTVLALDVRDVRDFGQGRAKDRSAGFGGRDDSRHSFNSAVGAT